MMTFLFASASQYISNVTFTMTIFFFFHGKLQYLLLSVHIIILYNRLFNQKTLLCQPLTTFPRRNVV